MTAPHVAILITTFQRPAGLQRLLASLDKLDFLADAAPRLSIIVVDNDKTAPIGAAVVGAWSCHPLTYVVEPEQGLSAARNRALELVPDDADYFAFIDDDEWAEPQWLAALLATQAESGADIIQGPVIPSFERPAPAWMTAGGYYEVGPFSAGEHLDFGASGNCLFTRKILDATGLRFDMAYNLSGGEDADLFARLLAAGHAIVAAPDARAHEHVPAERMTMRALWRLQFRKGNTIGRMALASRSPRQIAERAIKAAAWILRGLVETIAFGALAEGAAPRGTAGIMRGIGMYAAFLHITSDYYTAGRTAPLTDPPSGSPQPRHPA